MKYLFEWDPAKDRINQAKHNVNFRRSTLIFHDPLAVSIYDDDHSLDEQRWLTIGQTNQGVLLVVAHTFNQVDEEHTIVRLFSSRRATPRERRQYEAGS